MFVGALLILMGVAALSVLLASLPLPGGSRRNGDRAEPRGWHRAFRRCYLALHVAVSVALIVHFSSQEEGILAFWLMIFGPGALVAAIRLGRSIVPR